MSGSPPHPLPAVSDFDSASWVGTDHDLQGAIGLEDLGFVEMRLRTSADTRAPSFSGLNSATTGDEQVTLSWSTASDPSTPITDHIDRRTSSSSHWSTLLDLAPGFSFSSSAFFSNVTMILDYSLGLNFEVGVNVVLPHN